MFLRPAALEPKAARCCLLTLLTDVCGVSPRERLVLTHPFLREEDPKGAKRRGWRRAGPPVLPRPFTRLSGSPHALLQQACKWDVMGHASQAGQDLRQETGGGAVWGQLTSAAVLPLE